MFRINRITPTTASFVIALLLGSAIGASVNPIDNPHEFRRQVHQIPATSSPSGRIVVPEIAPLSQFELKANFDDLLISETVGPANFSQDKADIARLKGGRMVAAWQDDRLGPLGIFIQIYRNDGIKIGVNTSLVLGDSYNVTDPDLAADTLGYFYLVWREDVHGYLQAARFDSLGALVTPVFFISDTIQASYAGVFSADCTPDGRLIVVWEDYSIGNTISLQIFSITGAILVPLTTVNSDGDFVSHWSPDVAAGPNGDIMVVWEDYRINDTPDIYSRRFNASGVPYGAEALLSDASARDSARYLPSIVFSASDGYTVGWVDLRSGQNIYLQRMTTAGAINGGNILLTSETTADPNWEIDLGTSSAGNLLASWTVYSSANAIMLQRYNSSLVKDGSAQVVSTASLYQRFRPAIAGNRGGNIGVVWTEFSTGMMDVYGAVMSNAGAVVTPNFMVNDDATGSPASEPVVTLIDKYEWEVVFTDQRRDAGDIMLQRVYVGGTLLATNRRINADPAGGIQNQPAVGCFYDKLCISWTDSRATGLNILCRFSRPHYDLTDEITVNDVSAGSRYTSDCALNRLNQALIVWTDTRSGSPRIYGQRFSEQNAKVGGNFLIGPSEPARFGELPRIVADSNDNFIVGYLNRLNPAGPAATIKKVLANGTITDTFTFVSDQSGFDLDGFDIGIDAAGKIFLVWRGFSPAGNDLFLTVLNSTGGVITATQSLIDNPLSNPGTPAVSVDPHGYLVVAWLDSRTGKKTPFRTVLDPSLTPLSGNEPVYTTVAPFMQQPAVAGYRGRGIYVWSDARANGLKVYAAQEIYNPTDADDQTMLPSQYSLEQNNPNPFNPTTTIHFSLARGGNARLEVFNILGQQVRLLTNQNYPAGRHTVEWDGADDAGNHLASGIYFYRLQSGEFSRTQKMLLMK